MKGLLKFWPKQCSQKEVRHLKKQFYMLKREINFFFQVVKLLLKFWPKTCSTKEVRIFFVPNWRGKERGVPLGCCHVAQWFLPNKPYSRPSPSWIPVSSGRCPVLVAHGVSQVFNPALVTLFIF